MWLVLTAGLLLLAGGIIGFYLGWTARADEHLYRDDGPATLPDSHRSPSSALPTSKLRK